jgi:hypothetical protein
MLKAVNKAKSLTYKSLGVMSLSLKQYKVIN